MWKDIPGYEGIYQASPEGEIKSVDRYVSHGNAPRQFKRGRILKQGINNNGYPCVMLTDINGHERRIQVHRLIAITFIPNPENKSQVNHIDENKLNNNVDNLNWMSAKENCNWGTRNKRVGENTRKKLTGTEPPGRAVKNLDTGEVFDSIAKAARSIGATNKSGNIVRAIKNGYKCAGYRWKYV